MKPGVRSTSIIAFGVAIGFAAPAPASPVWTILDPAKVMSKLEQMYQEYSMFVEGLAEDAKAALEATQRAIESQDIEAHNKATETQKKSEAISETHNRPIASDYDASQNVCSYIEAKQQRIESLSLCSSGPDEPASDIVASTITEGGQVRFGATSRGAAVRRFDKLLSATDARNAQDAAEKALGTLAYAYGSVPLPELTNPESKEVEAVVNMLISGQFLFNPNESDADKERNMRVVREMNRAAIAESIIRHSYENRTGMTGLNSAWHDIFVNGSAQTLAARLRFQAEGGDDRGRPGRTQILREIALMKASELRGDFVRLEMLLNKEYAAALRTKQLSESAQ